MNNELSLNEILKRIASELCDVMSYLYDQEDSLDTRQQARDCGKSALEKLNELLPYECKQQFQVYSESESKYVNTTGDWWVDAKIKEYKEKH